MWSFFFMVTLHHVSVGIFICIWRHTPCTRSHQASCFSCLLFSRVSCKQGHGSHFLRQLSQSCKPCCRCMPPQPLPNSAHSQKTRICFITDIQPLLPPVLWRLKSLWGQTDPLWVSRLTDIYSTAGPVFFLASRKDFPTLPSQRPVFLLPSNFI
jgi:hypothetical protein